MIDVNNLLFQTVDDCIDDQGHFVDVDSGQGQILSVSTNGLDEFIGRGSLG